MDLCKVLWAKKDDYQGKWEWLPLLQHLEDTSRVCGFLWDHWLCDGQRKIISGNHDQDMGRQVMVFLGAIHDLGKATPAFQIKRSKLCDDQLARWLIMFQGYTGTGDKKKVEDVKDKKITYSKGWLYDLGGIYLKGDNLFETLMLNCILSSDIDVELGEMKIQIPSWERTSSKNVDIYFHNQVDNRRHFSRTYDIS